MADTDLDDLVDSPRETLEIEMKRWLDLDDPVVRAKLARHAAALANHGGGYLVFGFNDDLSQDSARPVSLTDYSRDTFSGIFKKYLSPLFQCEVVFVKNKDGLAFPVVRVPGHGRTPVMAKANGPSDASGRTQGVHAGTCYIRKPGPESAPAIGDEDWAPLIRRCLLNDRDRLLRDFAALVQTPAAAEIAPHERLREWHEQSAERFGRILAAAPGLEWPVPLAANHYQLSYLISTEGGEAIPEADLVRILDEVNNEVRDTVWTGWSMFYPFTRPEIAPAFHPEHLDGTGSDVLETDLIGDGTFDISLPDFWRVTPDGRASIVRAYREDRGDASRPAGSWLSPETVLRETAELVTHARLLARRYATASAISFRCTWIGLRGRRLFDFDPRISWGHRPAASADRRIVDGAWSLAQLAADWPKVVSDLSCPVLRLFSLDQCGPELVRQIAPRFVKLRG